MRAVLEGKTHLRIRLVYVGGNQTTTHIAVNDVPLCGAYPHSLLIPARFPKIKHRDLLEPHVTCLWCRDRAGYIDINNEGRSAA